MTEKYELKLCSNGIYYLYEDSLINQDISFDKFNRESAKELVSILNKQNKKFKDLLNKQDERIIIRKENEYQMNDVFALTAYDWEFTEHYLYNMKEIPNKNELDKIWKIAYNEAKSKVRSGIRTKPNSDEILVELVNLLKEIGIYPLKVWDYDVDNKKVREDDRL